MAIDYAYKSYILNNFNDLLIAQRKALMLTYSICLYHQFGIVSYSLEHSTDESETYEELKQYCDSTNLSKEFRECERINHAWWQRVKRLRERMTRILECGACSFLTLTFTDEVLQTTSAETRKRYVTRFLKSFGVPYVANVDFGSKNHREHYHAVIGCIVPSGASWSYGFKHVQTIQEADEKSVVCLSKYVSKLSNHAIKETTQRNALIYSR